MRRSLSILLPLLVLCIAPAAFADAPAESSEAAMSSPTEALIPTDAVPESLEPLPWELSNPDYKTHIPDYCNDPCDTNAQCVGICPGGTDAYCLRGFGTCGGSSFDKFCQCI